MEGSEFGGFGCVAGEAFLEARHWLVPYVLLRRGLTVPPLLEADRDFALVLS